MQVTLEHQVLSLMALILVRVTPAIHNSYRVAVM